MLETALIFAAGFLTASVLALMILPGINARASRLARRRLAAQFPISIAEVTAQMDYIRAESAIVVRNLERRLEREREAHARRRAQLDGLEIATGQQKLAERTTQESLSPHRIMEENALLRQRIEEISDKICLASASPE